MATVVKEGKKCGSSSSAHHQFRAGVEALLKAGYKGIRNQAQLAAVAGLTRGSVNQIINWQKPGSPGTWDLLAQAFDLQASDVIAIGREELEQSTSMMFKVVKEFMSLKGKIDNLVNGHA